MNGMLKVAAIALAGIGVTAGMAGAEPIDGKQAGRMLFSAGRSEVVYAKDTGLSAGDMELVKTLFKLSDKKVSPALLAAAGVSPEAFEAALAQFRDASYYGALAVAPGKGVVSPGTQMVQNLHSPRAARIAALTACQEAAQVKCVVVAQVMPRRYKERDLTLSQSATGDFDDYLKGPGPKSFAISPSTAAYAVARGFGSGKVAVAECNRLGGKDDCEVAVAD